MTKGRIIAFLNHLATVLLVHSKALLDFLTTRAHCRLVFSFRSTRSPSSFTSKLLLQLAHKAILLQGGVILPPKQGFALAFVMLILFSHNLVLHMPETVFLLGLYYNPPRMQD